jgi:flagellar M-ring protein FliF
LVSAAVPGLDPANVTLTDTRGQVLSSSSGGPSGDDKRAEQTNSYELALASKAESMLAQVYGAGRISVRVSADLDFDAKSTEVTTYEPTSAIPVRKSTSVEEFTGSGTPPNATAGILGGTDADTSADGNTYRKDEVSEESVVGSSVERTTTAPGGVKSLSAAAIVDDSLNPAPDVDQIKSLISAAIGAKPDRDSIVVESLTFDEKVKSDLANAATASASSEPSPLLNYIRMGVGAVVLLLVLLFLRKSLKTTSEPVALPADQQPQQPVRPVGDSTVFDLDEIDARGIPTELRLLDAEPDALANTLRSWVADRREVVR